MTLTETIAHRLGAWRQRDGQWRCECPLGCGYTLALREGEYQEMVVYCFGGHSYDEILAVLVGEYGLLEGSDADDGVPPEEPVRNAVSDVERIAGALKIYEQGGPGSLVANYLCECRCITLIPPEILREHCYCPHRLGFRMKAMLAPIVDINGEQTAVHMTYLQGDGSRKADLPKEYQREVRGVLRGGTIRLAPHDPDTELVIGEGLESTLSAMQIFGLPGWSAIDAGNLKRLPLPDAVRRIVIAGDNDLAGISAAMAARQRWRAEGREARIVLPCIIGNDFNNVLLAGR